MNAKIIEIEKAMAEQRRFFTETEEGRRLSIILKQEAHEENVRDSLWRKRQWERGEDVE